MAMIGEIAIHAAPLWMNMRRSNFKLSPDVPVSDAFRVEMQAWLDGFFGTHEIALVMPSDLAAFLGPDAMKKMGLIRI